MINNLAIYTPGIGVPSETFIRRHFQKLLPGRTVGICDVVLKEPRGNWGVECDLFEISTRINWAFHKMRQQVSGGKPIPVYDPLMRFLERSQVEVILGEFLDQSLPLFRLLRGTGYRFFVHAHGFDVTKCLSDEKMRDAYLEYGESDGVITMSEVSRRILIDSGLPENKVHTAHYGIEVPSSPLHEPSETNLIRCLAVGRMANKKSPIYLLEAFRRAYAMNNSLRLDYIGAGELAVMASQFVKCFHLESVVTFHGVQSSSFVQEMLRKADMFMQHSITDPSNGDMEGLPLAILEAMAHGLPVVSTRHAGIPEQVLEGRTGLLVEEGDVEGMSSMVLQLAADAGFRRVLGQAGYDRARDTFNWEMNRSRLLAILNLKQG